MDNSNTVPEALHSFGIELEFNTPVQKKLTSRLQNEKIPARITYDVSAQSDVVVENFSGLPVYGDVSNFEVNGETQGGELVTHIWNIRNAKARFSDLVKILNIFQSFGEAPTSSTAGIHFHVAFPRVLDGLKNVMTLGAHFEKFFFSIGGFGYPHRALASDAVYYRPITKSGPIVVPVENDGWAQCFSVKSLQASKSMEEFFQRYGDSMGGGGRARYAVVRYHYFNLLNMTKNTQTAEIRVFNTTLDPLKIWANLVFYMAMLRYAVAASPAMLVRDGFGDEQSVFDDAQEPLITTLERGLKAFRISDKLVVNTLMTLAEKSSETKLSERLIRSHLHDRHRVAVHWENLKKIPEPLIPMEKINHPDYTDSHTLSGNINPQTKWRNISHMRRESVERYRYKLEPYAEYSYPTGAVDDEESYEDDSRAIPTFRTQQRNGTRERLRASLIESAQLREALSTPDEGEDEDEDNLEF